MSNPDEQHTKYFDQNPNGNHDKPSRKTLELLNNLERRLEDKIDQTVTKTTFWTVNSIMVSILTGIMGVSFWLSWSTMQQIRLEVKEINNKTESTNSIVSKIQGQLEPFDFVTKTKEE